MILKDFLAISGKQGLYRFIAQGRNAIIVEHLETGKRGTAQNTVKVSTLEDISIFTETEDLLLGKVFDRIFEKEKGGPAIDEKSPAEKLKTYFEEVIPEFDKNRVYTSDIKKVLLWYNLLQKLNLLVKDVPESSDKAKEELQPEVKTPVKTGPKHVIKPKAKSTRKPDSKSAATKSKGAPKTK